MKAMEFLVKVVLSIFLTFFTFLSFAKGQTGQESHCTTLDLNNQRTAGYCIDIKSQLKLCPSHYNLLKMKDWVKLRTFICSTDNKRVCCPVKEFNETIALNPDEERISKIKFNTHRNFKLLPRMRFCGQSFYGSAIRIINGNTSLPGEFPWVARIGFESVGSSGISYRCGGSIISKRYILTAAHCFKDPNKKLVHVRVGQSDEEKAIECIELESRSSFSISDNPIINITTESEEEFHEEQQHDEQQQLEPRKIRRRQVELFPVACEKAVDIPVEKLIVHPGYSKQTGSTDDIALIRLAKDINFKSLFTKPICLPFLNEYFVKHALDESRTYLDEKTLVAGFGVVHKDEHVGSTTLQYVASPIQPNIMCRIAYKGYNVTRSQICAGGVSGTGSCLGDSGGPLSYTASPVSPEGNSLSHRNFLLGIVSYGKTRCAGNEPVVYTKVRSYLEWILDNMQE